MEIFLDEFCVFNHLEDHEDELQLCFDCCNQYEIFLNATKCQFLVLKRKLLGHIISEDGISMDLAKIEVIFLLPLPQPIIDVQAFFGHVGYY
jgi:hypothetical protein